MLRSTVLARSLFRCRPSSAVFNDLSNRSSSRLGGVTRTAVSGHQTCDTHRKRFSRMAQRFFRDEDAIYRRPSETMQYFHSIFQEEFNDLYELADGTFNKRGMGLQSFLRMGSQFVQHLTMHHTIEERNIFPILAERMPAFKEDAQHVDSHKKIHDGLDRLTELLKAYRREPSTYSPTAFRECLDSFKEVLFNHLDQEVKDLAPEEFRKHYTAEEMSRLPLH